MDSVDVDGLRIAFTKAGRGRPVVLLGGFVGDGFVTWRRQIEALSTSYTVVAWDPPGSGASSDVPESFRLPDYADCLAGLVSALMLEEPVIVGCPSEVRWRLSPFGAMVPRCGRCFWLVPTPGGLAHCQRTPSSSGCGPAWRRRGWLLRRSCRCSCRACSQRRLRQTWLPSSAPTWPSGSPRGIPHDGACLGRGRSTWSTAPDRRAHDRSPR